MTTFTAQDRVAQTILDQLGIPTLMMLGAHKVERYLDAVRFKVKLPMPGKRQARIMQAEIQLTAADLYRLRVGYLDRKTFDWVALEDREGLFADQMIEIMRGHARRA